MGWLARCSLLASVLALSCTYGEGKKDELHSALVGRRFLSESVEGAELLPNTQLSVRFRARELGASVGCNSLDGEYFHDASELVLLGVGMTEMGCDAARHAQDEWMVDLLTARPSLALAGPRLTLSTADTQVTLLDFEVANPDRPLVGTAWTGQALSDGSTVTGGPYTKQMSVWFDPGGTVTIQTGCHQGSAAYSVDGALISFDSLAYDTTPCADATLQQLSERVELVLDGSPVSFTIDASELELQNGDDSLLFRASD